MSTFTHSKSPLYDSFSFVQPKPGFSRSPCPALNALANHGYIPRNGTNISFWTLFGAIRHVYNLSFPLAMLLTTVGYITSGTLSLLPAKQSELSHNDTLLTIITRFLPHPSWTLNLASLCITGPYSIAHDASLVHKDVPGSMADPALVAQLLTLAHHKQSSPYNTSLSIPIKSKYRDGLTLCDLGCLHAEREDALPPTHKLNKLHEQVALGECGLAWCVMRTHDEDPEQGTIPVRVLEQWFGEERLPDGWWDVGGGRPVREVGLREAAKRAAEVGLFKDQN
ncbi:hypothetical protein H2248_002456 [Termitomyces sp. 'cryptogamus']|nr:hypothetical protein H2248_002456 [Termitomyces sp. 'cryptogamus']